METDMAITGHLYFQMRTRPIEIMEGQAGSQEQWKDVSAKDEMGLKKWRGPFWASSVLSKRMNTKGLAHGKEQTLFHSPMIM